MSLIYQNSVNDKYNDQFYLDFLKSKNKKDEKEHITY